MFLQMLKDEFPDVRLHIISKLELVNKGISSFKNQKLLLLLMSFSHRHRASVSITTPCHCTASRRQAMARPISHYWVHPIARRPTWTRLLRRQAEHALHELAGWHRFLDKGSSYQKPEETDWSLWSWVGKQRHNSKGHCDGQTPELPLPNDHMLRHFGMHTCKCPTSDQQN